MFSDRFNAIFVHIPRTGGQSVEHVFARMHGLSWKNRSGLLLGVNPSPGGNPVRLAHLFAREYVEKGFLPAERFESAIRFTTVRNPYDRILSVFRYRVKKQSQTFEEFVKCLGKPGRDRHLATQASFVCGPDRTPLTDRILRFETLEQDFEGISQLIFGRAVELPHLNKSPRVDEPGGLDAAVKEMIYRNYEADFDLFRYPRGQNYHSVGGKGLLPKTVATPAG